jgi:mannitol/fructose-specific phosphotransferase system IIA component (Ntr-type)
MLIQMNKNKNNKMNKTKKSLLQKIAQMFTDKSIVEEIMNAETFERALVPELGFEI